MGNNTIEFYMTSFKVDSNHKISINLKGKEDEIKGYIVLNANQLTLLQSLLEAEKVLSGSIINEILAEKMKINGGEEFQKIIKQIVKKRKENE